MSLRLKQKSQTKHSKRDPSASVETTKILCHFERNVVKSRILKLNKNSKRDLSASVEMTKTLYHFERNEVKSRILKLNKNSKRDPYTSVEMTKLPVISNLMK